MSLESLCLIHNQQGPASPAVRTRQCSQRMAHWTRDGSEGGFQSVKLLDTTSQDDKLCKGVFFAFTLEEALRKWRQTLKKPGLRIFWGRSARLSSLSQLCPARRYATQWRFSLFWSRPMAPSASCRVLRGSSMCKVHLNKKWFRVKSIIKKVGWRSVLSWKPCCEKSCVQHLCREIPTGMSMLLSKWIMTPI